MADTKPLPCPNPWCEGKQRALISWPHLEGRAIQCTECLLTGPRKENREAAIAAWNTRPALTPKQKAAEELYELLKEVNEFGLDDSQPSVSTSALYRKIDLALDAYRKAGQPC